MESATDAELVARCLANEQGAWEELVDRYARYVYAIAARVYRLDPTDADDVFQEVFARVFERLDTLRDVDALRPRCAICGGLGWLPRVRRNLYKLGVRW